MERAAVVAQLADEFEQLLGEESFKGEFDAQSTASVDAPSRIATPSSSNGNHAQQIPKGSLFGKSIREAAVEVLRIIGKPMGMKDVVDALETSDFQFESKDHYFSLYRALRDDRRPVEIIKQGELYGLRQRVAKTI